MTSFGPVDHGLLEFTIQDRPCAILLPQDGRLVASWAATGNWPQIFPYCLHPDYEEPVWERMADRYDAFGMRAMWKVVMTIAPDIYGVEWWSAERMLATAEANWGSFSTWCVGKGFDFTAAPAHMLVSGAWGWITNNAKDEKEFAKLQQKFFAPPKPLSKKRMKSVPGFTPQEQAAGFQAAMASLGSG